MSITSEQLQAAEIISQLVSCPWMCWFYRNAGRTFIFVEALTQVKTVVGSVEDLESDDVAIRTVIARRNQVP